MQPPAPAFFVAIACGGTGGHLFPGLAVAEELQRRHCEITLLVSAKDVDQQAVRSRLDMSVVTLPAVGMTRRNVLGFWKSFFSSYRQSKRLFAQNAPDAVLAMGGFTSVPPLLAARKSARTFLHESNTIPGRANRWLAHFVDHAFVYFHEASGRMSNARIEVTGMPVREQIREPMEAAAARMALNLDPAKPVLLVMGGSQGAKAINDLLIASLPQLANAFPDLQFIHLTGPADAPRVDEVYRVLKRRAVVRSFFTEMEFALHAATAAITRAGASTLAELAALRLPAILLPFPAAADNHQYYNALAFAETGAARMSLQNELAPQRLIQWIGELTNGEEERTEMQEALARWDTPGAAARIADFVVASFASGRTGVYPKPLLAGDFNAQHRRSVVSSLSI